MRFGVLGPLAVWTDEGDPVRVPELKVRSLLAALLVEPGRAVSTDRLALYLWGDDQPGNPANSLQNKVSQLRRALERAEPGGRELVVHRPPGYALAVTTDNGPEAAVDSDRFHALTARARAAEEPRTRAALFAEALALWRGPAFADCADVADEAAPQLEEHRLTAVEDAALARLESGEHTLVADDLREHTLRQPLRERLHGVHMLALYRSGRPAEALSTFAELRERLAEELGADPGPELAALHQRILEQDPGLAAPAASGGGHHPGNLPAPPTGLVGRKRELGRVSDALRTARLVTLTGPGGVGKTRLALALARQEQEQPGCPDGVWLVELAGLRPDREAGPDPSAVVGEVATALGLRDRAPAGADPLTGLSSALSGHRALLVLDNCEHVLDSVAPVVSALLRSAPELRVLCTSQEPLAVAGEVLESVAPLGLPEAAGLPAALDSDAVRLFTERAAAAAPGFVLTEDNAADTVAVCRRLDGIPLALELAAARVRTLGVGGLLKRIDDRFRVLSGRRREVPARQRTLRAMIEWSWELAAPAEQAVLRRLSVHAEGCSLAAAEEVCAGPGVPAEDVLDLLERLVDRSLVRSFPDMETPRFGLLESVAEYGREQLARSGEESRVRGRHAAHHLALAERAEPHLFGNRQLTWLRRLDTEKANIRAALRHSLAEGDGAAALRLVNAMAPYLRLRGRHRTAHTWLASVLGDIPEAVLTSADPSGLARATAARVAFGLHMEAPADPVTATGGAAAALDATEPEHLAGRIAHARSRWFLGYAHLNYGTLDLAEQLVQQALRSARALDDPWVEAAALFCRADLAHFRGDLGAQRRDAERSLLLFEEAGDGWGSCQALDSLAVHAETTGDHERAARSRRRAAGVAEGLRLWLELSRQLAGLGRLALLERDHDRAEELLRRAYRVGLEHGDGSAQEFAAVGLGMCARRKGDLEAAEAHLRPWLAWNLRLDTELGAALILAELGFTAELRGDATAALDLHRRGLAMALRIGDPRAVALALEGLAGARSVLETAEGAREAARLLGRAAAARDSVGAPLPEAEHADVDRIAARGLTHQAKTFTDRATGHEGTLTVVEAG
jgi:predicted ATPase/DNA-binding SARP family transcriptional activator